MGWTQRTPASLKTNPTPTTSASNQESSSRNFTTPASLKGVSVNSVPLTPYKGQTNSARSWTKVHGASVIENNDKKKTLGV